MFLIMMLLKVDVAATIRMMGRGIFVMLFGTAGVVLGAPIAFLIVKDRLPADTWKAFGSLAGSWIGGTGNMAAVTEGLKTSEEGFGLAVLGDNLVYIVWLPILLGSKSSANRFNRLVSERGHVFQGRYHALERTQKCKIQNLTPLPSLCVSGLATAPRHPTVRMQPHRAVLY